MRFVTFKTRHDPTVRLGLRAGGRLLALTAADAARGPKSLRDLLTSGPTAMQETARSIERIGKPVASEDILYLPPVPEPAKIICVGLNYLDHTKESRLEQPPFPTLFLRLASSLVGHEQVLVQPRISDQFDYEGELAAFIGTGGRHIPKAAALDHIAGFSVSNEGSVRDFQFRSPQWTIGKNFDRSGSIGPDFVSADELPRGGAGLRIETRLNAEVVQSANTADMVFDLATVVALVSEAMTLEPGDVILTGTPAGVGFARTPPRFMAAGDVVEVEVEGVGLLRNRIEDEAR